MNHIPDIGKMVSDTPRTDEVLLSILHQDGQVDDINCPEKWVEFARQLERELRRACQMYSKLDLHALNLAARITRLEKAGNLLKDRYILENENWDLQTVNDWNDAKEAKP